MKQVLSVISKVFLVIFIFLYGAVNIASQITAANASVISNFLGQDGFNMIKDETLGADEELDTQYFKSAYSSVKEVKEAGEILTQKVMEEGAVLLKNDNGALPLASTDKISLFSASSVDPIVSGYREMYEKKTGTVNLLDGFKEAGLTVNDTRKQSVNFTESYYNAAQMLVVKENETSFDNCKTAEDVLAVLASKVAPKAE